MTQTFTSIQNDIIRYVYNETSSTENPLIEEIIAKDSEALDFFLDCLQLKEQMSQIELAPSSLTVQSILNYSLNYCK